MREENNNNLGHHLLLADLFTTGNTHLSLLFELLAWLLSDWLLDWGTPAGVDLFCFYLWARQGYQVHPGQKAKVRVTSRVLGVSVSVRSSNSWLEPSHNTQFHTFVDFRKLFPGVSFFDWWCISLIIIIFFSLCCCGQHDITSRHVRYVTEI